MPAKPNEPFAGANAVAKAKKANNEPIEGVHAAPVPIPDYALTNVNMRSIGLSNGR